jgi:tyrosine-specific transport protein
MLENCRLFANLDGNMKTLGSALLISGTAIGAGMLGIPMATAGLGFVPSVILLVSIWLISYFAALIMLEVTLNTPGDKLHINSMARDTLGRFGQLTAWTCVLGLLYSLTVAYISGASSILKTLIDLPQWILACVFTVVLGVFVIASHRAADLLNRSLFGIKTVLLIAVLAFCLPVVDVSLLKDMPVSQGLFLSAAPVIVVSFGFHHIIPSLAQYNQGNLSVLKRVILIGSVLPLIVYILWEMIALGLVPRNELVDSDVGVFINSLSALLGKPWLSYVINGFANLALITSFLGVSLGLFDFLCDSLKVNVNRTSHRAGVGVITYLFPLICAIFIPTGFIQLLAYGGVFFAIMAFVMPPLMVFVLRRRGGVSVYQTPGLWAVPVMVLAAGLGVVGMILLG